MQERQAYFISARYLLLIILGIFINLFYFIFTPLTIYPVLYLLSIIYPTAQLLSSNILSFQGFQAQIIPACVAGAAYYLFLILNLTTPIDPKTRIRSILFLLTTFLVLNILRITISASLLVFNFRYFDFTHLFFWYFGSTLLVILLWFVNVKLFRIKSIPVFTDFKNIFRDVKK